MNTNNLTKLVAVVSGLIVAVILTSGVAWAQESQAINFETQFPFMVGQHQYPAGRYDIVQEGSSLSILTLRPTSPGQSIILPILTRLAEQKGTEAQIVFDKAADKYFLAEIHIPGFDGFAIQGAPGEHTHVRVSGKKK